MISAEHANEAILRLNLDLPHMLRMGSNSNVFLVSLLRKMCEMNDQIKALERKINGLENTLEP